MYTTWGGTNRNHDSAPRFYCVSNITFFYHIFTATSNLSHSIFFYHVFTESFYLVFTTPVSNLYSFFECLLQRAFLNVCCACYVGRVIFTSELVGCVYKCTHYTYIPIWHPPFPLSNSIPHKAKKQWRQRSWQRCNICRSCVQSRFWLKRTWSLWLWAFVAVANELQTSPFRSIPHHLLWREVLSVPPHIYTLNWNR